MGKRVFSLEFKLEAVKLVLERGIARSEAARQLGVHVNVLRKWINDYEADPQQAFPGPGQMKPEQAELERLRRENVRPRAERDDSTQLTYKTRGSSTLLSGPSTSSKRLIRTESTCSVLLSMRLRAT